MGQGLVLYPKRKERGLIKIAGNEVNSVINQITNTTTVTSLDAVPDGVTYGKLRNSNLTLGALSTLTRELAASGYKITGLGAGSTAGNAVRYEQVLLLAGGTMTGAIAMGANKITGLAAGTVAGDAVRYEQLTGGSTDLWKHRRTGAYHFTQNIAYPGTQAILQYKLMAVPFYCASNYTLTKMGIYVDTAASGFMRVGIYEDDGNCFPGALLLDAGVLALNTAGEKEITGLSTSLIAGNLYWVANVASSANLAVILNGFDTSDMLQLQGFPTVATVPQAYAGYEKDFAYNPLPDPFPTDAVPYPVDPFVGLYLT